MVARRDDYAQQSRLGTDPDTRHDARMMFWSDFDDSVKVEPQRLITLRARHGMKMLLTTRIAGGLPLTQAMRE
jgi:hypothetical protein